MDAKELMKAVSPVGMTVLLVGDVARDEKVEKDLTLPVDTVAIRRQTLVDLLKVSGLKVDTRATRPSNDVMRKYDLVVLSRVEAGNQLALQVGTPQQLVNRDMLATNDGKGITNIEAVYTGVVPIVYKAQQALLQSLIQSTNWSFLTITPLMMFVARSWRAGLVAMLPNALPVLVVFGAMGWMGIEVDVGSMMTASIALGVAVDDTIHYLTWFRQELAANPDRKVAILNTYNRCATPTFQAALISGLGLSIFAFSTFTPTQRFGTLMLTILWAGVAAELIYFPALLAGPLGSVFAPAKGAHGHGHSEPVATTVHVPAPEPEPEEVEDPVGAGTVKFPLVKPHLVRRDGPHKAAQ
jgi:hypothetical protein